MVAMKCGEGVVQEAARGIMMNGVYKRLILVLVSLSFVAPVFADSRQRPRKEPEVIKEKEKPKPDSRDQGNDRKPKEDQKKKGDDRKKP
jgi:hypothetical protein